MKYEERFWDAAFSEAFSGETPPDLVARVLAGGASPSGAPAGRRAPARRTGLWRAAGVFAATLVLGFGVGYLQAWWFAPAGQAPAHEAWAGEVAAMERRVDELLDKESAVESGLWASVARMSQSLERVNLAPPRRSKVESLDEVVVRVADQRDAKASELRRQKHVEHVLARHQRDTESIVAGLREKVGISDEEEKAARAVLEAWGRKLAESISVYHRRYDHRRHAPEVHEGLAELAVEAALGVRAVLDARRQLAFDDWIAQGHGGALAQGAERWAPPAVFNNWDDVDEYLAWQR
ncbi:hypothetical protein EDM80_13920 [bacterium]|nr:MAG: hypothetical protein EDM80_13920 [bacterium]RIK64626.1 MAG: hypothetical protein DCC64_03370 [Planctomycetota bacterium]